jgi:Outer membrane protein beta-barrel domain
MKKCALFVLILTFAATLGHSQVLIALLFGDKLTSEKFELGIRLAGNWQDLSGLEGTTGRFSIGFGIYGTLRLSEKFSLQPELLFKDPRGAEGVPLDVFGNPNLDPLLENAAVTAKLAYVSLPILFKYSLTPKLSLGFGPQIGYLSSARKEYVAQVYAEEDLVFKDDIKSKLNDFDFALAFNLEYKLLKKKGIHIGLRYYLGLTDIFKDNAGDPVRNSVIQVNLGIPVGKMHKEE